MTTIDSKKNTVLKMSHQIHTELILTFRQNINITIVENLSIPNDNKMILKINNNNVESTSRTYNLISSAPLKSNIEI